MPYQPRISVSLPFQTTADPGNIIKDANGNTILATDANHNPNLTPDAGTGSIGFDNTGVVTFDGNVTVIGNTLSLTPTVGNPVLSLTFPGGAAINLSATSDPFFQFDHSVKMHGLGDFGLGIMFDATTSAAQFGGLSGGTNNHGDNTSNTYTLSVMDLLAGTHAMRFLVMNSTASATSYEALAIDWQKVANRCTLNVVKGSGGGTLRGLNIGGAATDLVALYGVTPVVQPATTGTNAGFTQNAGNAVMDASTFTGNTGATAYRISDIVLALKQLGILAA